MVIDMWYNDKLEDVNKITIAFSDIDCVYRGNLWKDNKIIGDFSTPDSMDLYKAFPWFDFN